MAVFPSFSIIFSFFSLVFFSPSVAEVKGICELQSATDFIIASFVRLAGSNAELNPDAGITISRKGDHGLPVEFAWSTVRGSPVRIPAAKLFRSWLGVCCDPATSPTTTTSTTTPASLPTPCAIQTAPTASQAECGGSEVVVLAVLLSASLLALAVVSGILICERAEKKSLLQALGEVRRNATMRLGQPGGLEERRTTNISTAPLPPDASGYAADDEASTRTSSSTLVLEARLQALRADA